jgi:hypothetical protein
MSMDFKSRDVVFTFFLLIYIYKSFSSASPSPLPKQPSIKLMRPTLLPPSLHRSLKSFIHPRNRTMASQTSKIQQDADNSIKRGSSADLGIENTNVNTTAGVELSEEKKVLVGSVLDVGFHFFVGELGERGRSIWVEERSEDRRKEMLISMLVICRSAEFEEVAALDGMFLHVSPERRGAVE